MKDKNMFGKNTVIICVGGLAINSEHFDSYAIEKRLVSNDNDPDVVYRIVARGGVENKFENVVVCTVTCDIFSTDNEALVDVLDIFKELLQVLNDDDIEIHNVNDHPFFSDG